ncbi:MAG: WG repeat-containing protein [Clostridia bacterium]|nr:WG repeat-containing protein [Clostridia bacterium]
MINFLKIVLLGLSIMTSTESNIEKIEIESSEEKVIESEIRLNKDIKLEVDKDLEVKEKQEVVDEEEKLNNEQNLFLVKDKTRNKYGYKNYNGDIVIPIEYDYLSKFEFGLVIAEKNKKRGLIDKNGDVIVEIKYDDVEDIYLDKIAIVLNSKKGILDIKNNSLVELEYKDIKMLNSYVIGIKNEENYWILMSYNGEKISDEKFLYVDKLTDELTYIKKDKKLGIINNNGEILKLGIYNDIYALNEKIIVIKNNLGIELYNNQLEKLVNEVYEDAIKIGNVIALKKNGHFQIFNYSIEKVNDEKYSYIDRHDKNEELHKMRRDNKFGFLNSDGHEVIGPKYDNVKDYLFYIEESVNSKEVKDGIILVERNGKWGYIDEKDNILIDFKYIAATQFGNRGLAFVETKDSSGYINKQGEGDVNKYGIKKNYFFGNYYGYEMPQILRDGFTYDYYGYVNNRLIQFIVEYDAFKEEMKASYIDELGITHKLEGARNGLYFWLENDESKTIFLKVKLDDFEKINLEFEKETLEVKLANVKEYYKRYRKLGVKDEYVVEDFAENVKKTIFEDDKIKLSNMIKYPITIFVDNEEYIINDKNEFIKQYDKLITKEFKDEIGKAIPKNLICSFENGANFGYKSKNIWFDDFGIQKKNPLLDPRSVRYNRTRLSEADETNFKITFINNN